MTDAIDPDVEALLRACPFLLPHLDGDMLDLATVVFGATATALISHALVRDQEDAVFDYFNALAELGSADEVLGTGAIELFNDSADAQRLGRRKLTGRALAMLEDFRVYWGQPDYASPDD